MQGKKPCALSLEKLGEHAGSHLRGHATTGGENVMRDPEEI